MSRDNFGINSVVTYFFFALALVAAFGISYLVGCGFWLWWDLNHNLGSPN